LLTEAKLKSLVGLVTLLWQQWLQESRLSAYFLLFIEKEKVIFGGQLGFYDFVANHLTGVGAGLTPEIIEMM
jgi:hypothetical protein